MTARLARQVKWYTGLQPLPLATAINRGLSTKSRTHKKIHRGTSKSIIYAQSIEAPSYKGSALQALQVSQISRLESSNIF